MKWRGALLLLLVVFAFQAVVVFGLGALGWFDPILPWDDASFVHRAMDTAWLYFEFGLVPYLVRGASFHAPLGDVHSIIGFMISPYTHLGYYMLNGIYLFAGFVFLLYFFRNQPTWIKLCALLILLFFPPLFKVLATIKTDQVGGLATAIGVLLLFEPGRKLPIRTTGRMLLLAFVFACVVTAKMTAFFLPVVVIGIFTLSVFRLFRPFAPDGPPPGRRAEIVRHGVAVLLVLMFYGVFLALEFENLHAYVTAAIGDKWDDGFTLAEHILYWAPFGTAGRLYTAHLFATCILLALLLWRSPLNRDEVNSFLCLGIVMVVLAIPPVAVRTTHNDEFASNFYFALFAILMLALRSLAQYKLTRPNLQRRLMLGLCAVLLVSYQFEPRPGIRLPKLERLEQADAAFTRISEMIEAAGHEEHPLVSFLFSSGHVPYPNLAITHYRRTWDKIYIERADMWEDVPDVVSRSDYVIATDNSNGTGLVDRPSWTSVQRADEAIALIEATDDFDLVATLPVGDYNMLIYSRKAPSHN